MTRYPLLCVVISLFLWGTPAAGEPNPCDKSCDADIECERDVTACLIEADRARDAVERLKPLATENPDPAWKRLLARAYLANDNAFWAERTLLGALESHPDDCETVSWLVWVYLSTGDLALAEETLETPGCPTTPEDETRFHVLAFHIDRAKQNVEASAAHLEAIGDAERAYPEDRSLFDQYHRLENPGWIQPLSFKADLLGGYTSNARAGSPADATTGGTSSGVFKLDLFSRFTLPVSRNLRPTVEGNLKGHGITDQEASELSYLDLSLRPGIYFGDHRARLLAAYKGNLLLINLDDRHRYYESHRGELELDTHFGLLVFAGAGRRLFHEAGRTRTELDVGVGGTISVNHYLKLLLALTGRRYLAVGSPYDQVGGTALLAGILSFRPGILLRVGMTPMVDYYPTSGGGRGVEAFGSEEKRLDVLVKQFEEVWSPAVKGVRFGLRYEFSWRESNADRADNNYDYTEHRALLGVRWSLDLNPFAPKEVSRKGHIPLPYGVDSGEGSNEERIQDLLRQDEAARAGSACVD